MSSLVSEVNRCRVKNRLSLDSVPFGDIANANLTDPMEIRGRIAEKYVERWLSMCRGVSFDSNFPRRVNGYSAEQRDSGIVLMDGTRTVHEFDFLIFYEGAPAVVQVKSFKLNGIESKLSDSLRLGKEIYNVETLPLLLFFPAYGNKRADAERIESAFPEVSCIDSGYKKKQLAKAMNDFYASLGLNPPKPKHVQ